MGVAFCLIITLFFLLFTTLAVATATWIHPENSTSRELYIRGGRCWKSKESNHENTGREPPVVISEGSEKKVPFCFTHLQTELHYSTRNALNFGETLSPRNKLQSMKILHKTDLEIASCQGPASLTGEVVLY